jgi:hypothetical protein
VIPEIVRIAVDVRIPAIANLATLATSVRIANRARIVGIAIRASTAIIAIAAKPPIIAIIATMPRTLTLLIEGFPHFPFSS